MKNLTFTFIIIVLLINSGASWIIWALFVTFTLADLALEYQDFRERKRFADNQMAFVQEAMHMIELITTDVPLLNNNLTHLHNLIKNANALNMTKFDSLDRDQQRVIALLEDWNLYMNKKVLKEGK